MARKYDWCVSVDKLKVCLNITDQLYDYLKGHYTRFDELNKYRILEEDDFHLIFIEEDEQSMTAIEKI